ncbi:MAG TPA: tRNA pseudouridine(55) synthase TruB [Burkholderiales bacterium]|nr:tRNA pseudouridine(55) synthase TruB [Burkholderiales bacterium]
MRRKLDAALLLDKPPGISSNAALQSAKRLYRARKAGHAGTLDPLASGLLVVLFGEATKFAGPLLQAPKEYLARVRLGEMTTTGDAEGETLARREVRLSDAEIEVVLARFRGVVRQVPPMYSALKHGGRPLYELAREGRSIEREAREVEIHTLELLARDGTDLELHVRCSKGTYVRTLAEDIGAALGVGAHLAGLRRTSAGGLDVRQASTLEALERLDEAERDARLLPLEALLADLPRLELDAQQAGRFCNGQRIRVPDGGRGLCGVFGPQRRVLGLGDLAAGGELRPLRLIARSPEAVQAAE